MEKGIEYQFIFQHKYSVGKILNIGCNEDISKLRERKGAVNLDICRYDPGSLKMNKVDIVADARNLPMNCHKSFNTIIVGDLLEHCKRDDIKKILEESKKCLIDGGIILITFPKDRRKVDEQNTDHKDTDLEYTPGISVYHKECLELGVVTDILTELKLMIELAEEIDYGFARGWGLVVKEFKGNGI